MEPEATCAILTSSPYATAKKWGSLTMREQRSLLADSGDSLGVVLRESSVQWLVLNGRAVVKHFQWLSDVKLDAIEMPDWMLRRSGRPGVSGFAYAGVTERIGTVHLETPIGVLGYNHNLQSSFGVTSEVIGSIGDWL